MQVKSSSPVKREKSSFRLHQLYLLKYQLWPLTSICVPGVGWSLQVCFSPERPATLSHYHQLPRASGSPDISRYSYTGRLNSPRICFPALRSSGREWFLSIRLKFLPLLKHVTLSRLPTTNIPLPQHSPNHAQIFCTKYNMEPCY